MPVLKAERLPLNASYSFDCMTIWFYSTIRSGRWLTAHEPTPARSVLCEHIFFGSCPEKVRRQFLHVGCFYFLAYYKPLKPSPLFNSLKGGNRSCSLISWMPVVKAERLPLNASQSFHCMTLWFYSAIRSGGWLTAHEPTPARHVLCEQIFLFVVAAAKSAGDFEMSGGFISQLGISRWSQVLWLSRGKVVGWKCSLISWMPVMQAERLPLNASHTCRMLLFPRLL